MLENDSSKILFVIIKSINDVKIRHLVKRILYITKIRKLPYYILQLKVVFFTCFFIDNQLIRFQILLIVKLTILLKLVFVVNLC